MASCDASAGWARPHRSQRARLNAACRRGSASCSKRSRPSESNTSEPFPWPEELISRDRPGGKSVPKGTSSVTDKKRRSKRPEGNNRRGAAVLWNEARPMAARVSLATLNPRRSSLEIGGKMMPSLDRVEGTKRKKQTEEKIMPGKKKDEILHDHNHDGIDRRGFLKCMAWAGTGAYCVMSGGVLKSYSLSRLSEMNPAAAKGELSFVQITYSHMGFNNPTNPYVAGTLTTAVDKIKALQTAPEFLLHTGDISHLSKPQEFDTVHQILKRPTAKDVFFVPGEHDVLNDDGKQFLERYGKGSKGRGWYSFE